MACSCSKNTLLLSTATIISTSVALWSTYRLLRSKILGCFAKDTSQALVNECMGLHYGKENEICPLPWIPKDALSMHRCCADLCADHMKDYLKPANSRALDLGCGVGRMSFELAKYFKCVIGLENDYAFLAVCLQLKQYGQLVYSIVKEGELTSQHIAEVDPVIDRTRVEFLFEDTKNILEKLGQFECIFLPNLLFDFNDPRALLNEVTNILVGGGILVILSAYDWRDDNKKKHSGFGCTRDEEGNFVSGFEALRNELSPHFELVAQTDVPMVLRKTERKFVIVMNHATVWKKKTKN